MPLDTEANEVELESTNSTDSEGQITPTHASSHTRDHESSMTIGMNSLAVPHRHRNITDVSMSSEVSCASNKQLLLAEASLPQPKPPEIFVCHFNEDYSPDTHTSAPKHATMVPTDFLRLPIKTNAVSMNSFTSSNYMMSCGSMKSLVSDNSFNFSENGDSDYDTSLTATRNKLMHSRRKSLSENNLSTLCRPPPTVAKRRSSGTYQIKMARDIYNLNLLKPLKNTMSRYNSYLAISVSQNMVRNKHGGSTDV